MPIILASYSEGCDLLIIPTVLDSLDTDGLAFTLRALQDIGGEHRRQHRLLGIKPV
jgi:hypothetical protein